MSGCIIAKERIPRFFYSERPIGSRLSYVHSPFQAFVVCSATRPCAHRRRPAGSLRRPFSRRRVPPVDRAPPLRCCDGGGFRGSKKRARGRAWAPTWRSRSWLGRRKKTSRRDSRMRRTRPSEGERRQFAGGVVWGVDLPARNTMVALERRRAVDNKRRNGAK